MNVIQICCSEHFPQKFLQVLDVPDLPLKRLGTKFMILPQIPQIYEILAKYNTKNTGKI